MQKPWKNLIEVLDKVLETRKKLIEVFTFNTSACVFNVNNDGADIIIVVDFYLNEALSSEFNCIFQKVNHDLLKATLISNNIWQRIVRRYLAIINR